MRLHAKRDKLKGKITDLDTGKRVLGVIWVDVEGDYGTQIEAFQMKGLSRIRVGNEWLTYIAKGRFKFEPAKPVKELLLGAPSCVKCGNALTLPGEELCVVCKANDKGYKKFEPVNDGQCCKCSRPAQWGVSDEVEATPQAGTLAGVKVNFDRAAVVNTRYYCDFHWQPPRILDPKGEVIQELEDQARPH